MEEIYAYLDTLQTLDLSSKIDEMQGKIKQDIESDLQAIKTQISKTEKELELLNNEIIKTLTNESNFTAEQLSKIIAKKEDGLAQFQKDEEKLASELSNRLKEVHTFVQLQTMIPNWRQEFEVAETGIQKMLLAKILDSIIISNDSIDVHFKFNLYDLA